MPQQTSDWIITTEYDQGGFSVSLYEIGIFPSEFYILNGGYTNSKITLIKIFLYAGGAYKSFKASLEDPLFQYNKELAFISHLSGYLYHKDHMNI